jgi:phosphoribosylglycinamide formyltransferase-1
MYGRHVHQAVIDAKDPYSGITIHYVDNEYDRGDTIFQAKCPVDPSDTPESLAARVHALEYEHFPRVLRDEVLR